MKVDKYSIDGKVLGQVDLAESIFEAEINDVLVYELIKSLNANKRQGTHSTKQRAEVRGGGAKPWRQKGTGRARAGTSRSPIWTGGGVVFGPKPRDYRIDLPKKIKKAAYRSIFSIKAQEGAIRVVEDFTATGKTKEIAQIGKALTLTKGVLVAADEDANLKRAIKNISWFNYNNVKRLSGLDLFYSKEIVFTESALKYLLENF